MRYKQKSTLFFAFHRISPFTYSKGWSFCPWVKSVSNTAFLCIASLIFSFSNELPTLTPSFWRSISLLKTTFFFFFPRWSFEMRESLEIPALWNYIAFPIPPSSCTVAKDHAPYLIKYIISNFLFCLSLWTYSCLHTTSSCQIAVAFLLYFKWTSLRDLVLVVSLFQEWSLKTFHGEFHLF